MQTLRIALAALAALTVSVGALAERTTPVEVKNSPTVGIAPAANAVKAEQAGTWSVGISPSANTVKTPVQSTTVRLWPNDKGMLYNTSLTSDVINCDGYREIRGVLTSTSSSTSVTVQLRFIGPGGQHTTIGQCSFGGADTGLVEGSGFVKAGYTCTFKVPVMATQFQLNVINLSPDMVTLYSGNCWVYLVN